MADRRQMYLGSKTGITVLSERGDEWQTERTLLPGKQVQKLIAADGSRIMYAHAADGVYASTDRGQEWDQVFGAEAFHIAGDPSDPMSLYVGTEPVGFYCSKDAGDSWQEWDSLLRLPESVRDKWWFPVFPHESHVRTIFVEPRKPGRVYVGLEHGGILRTDDGGSTWEDVSDGIEYLDIHMVGCDPGVESLVYAATARGFYRSDDYGRDWVLSQDGIDRDDIHAFDARPGQHTALFLAATRGTPPSWIRPSGAEGAIYRSEDGGSSWQQLGGGLPSAQPRAFTCLAGDPADHARLYASAADHRFQVAEGAAGGGEVWASMDRGDSWAKIYEADVPVRLLTVATA